jgi:hypothetical protein
LGLGARAAGTDQLFPLAAQQIHVDESTLDVELISIDGFSLLPMGGLDGLTLPVPVFRPVPPKVKLGHLFLVPGFQYGDIKLGANLEDANAVEVAEIPVMFDKQKEELTLSFGLGSRFAIGLAWIGGRLSLKVSRTGRSTKSIPI